MSIRPMDLKMAIPKAQELSKVEQNNQDKLNFSLESQMNEQNQTIAENLKKVNDNEELSKAEIKEKEKKHQEEEAKKKEQEESISQPQSLLNNGVEGSIGKDFTIGSKIDIKA